MTVSAATRDKLNQWLNLKSPSGSDEQSLYDLLSLIEAYHSSFSMNTQRKLDDWLTVANGDLVNGGSGVGTTDFAKLRIATGGLQFNPWSLSSIEMQAFDEWLSLASTGFNYANKVLATSPLAYWQLNEGSGATIIDSSGNGYNGSYTGVTWDGTAPPQGGQAPFFDGANDYGNVHSAGFASAFDGAEGTLQVWVRVNSAAVWTDGQFRVPINFRADASANLIIFQKNLTNNTFDMIYRAGGTDKRVTFTISSTQWINFTMTWSAAANQMKTYVNGAQQGATQTGLGTWAGAPLSTNSLIGARSTLPDQVWHGYCAHAAIWDYPLTPAQVAALGTV